MIILEPWCWPSLRIRTTVLLTVHLLTVARRKYPKNRKNKLGIMEPTDLDRVYFLIYWV